MTNISEFERTKPKKTYSKINSLIKKYEKQNKENCFNEIIKDLKDLRDIFTKGL